MMTLKNNPFYILGVPVTANRREIACICEEKTLILGDEICNEARSTLTTPSKRLSAELRWFIDCSEELIKEIVDNSKYSSKLATALDEISSCSELSQLNACLAFFAENPAATSTVKTNVLRISRLFDSLNANDIKDLINKERRVSNFPEIEDNSEILSGLKEIKQEIKQTLNEKLISLSKSTYVSIVTSLAESYALGRAKGQEVLADVIASYQLDVNDDLQNKEKSIIRMAGFIAQSVDKIDVDRAVNDLINDLYAWDSIAQPIQLCSMTKGSSHENSQKVLSALRSLAITLHNDYQISEQSLKLTTAMKKVFAELPEDIDQIKNDEKTLIELSEAKKINKELEPLLEKYKNTIDGFKDLSNSQLSSAVDSLIKQTQVLDSFIKSNLSRDANFYELRETVCMAARSIAIMLHNERSNYELALQILKFLKTQFYDVPEISFRLSSDIDAVNRNFAARSSFRYSGNSSSYRSTNSYSSGGSWGWIIMIIIILIIGIGSCGAASPENLSNSKSNPTYSVCSTTHNYSSNKMNTEIVDVFYNAI